MEELSTGNIRSAKEAFRDVGISAVSGFITGAIGAKLPGAHRFVEGVVDMGASAFERFAYAAFDGSMSWREKLAYAFDPRQMVADFVTGIVIGELLDGLMAGIRVKLKNVLDSTPPTRPTWRQSEIDAAVDFPDYSAQKSFINGQEVPYGTKGSVRPDYYKNGYSVDIKNYNIENASGRSNLTRNIEKQYYQRIKNLPEGTKQSVMIDVRGQNVSDADLKALYNSIMNRTNDDIEILFKMN